MQPIFLLTVPGIIFLVVVNFALWKDASIKKSVAMNHSLITALSLFLLSLGWVFDATCTGWGCMVAALPAIPAAFITALQVFVSIIAFLLHKFKVSSLNNLFQVGYYFVYGILIISVILYLAYVRGFS